ncbi:MAG: flagellar basal body rod protein FlgB [Acidobacteria bacterium]|nr:flagellar basal body rod protein FlgB [Acidobacteriota bacterium]
MKIGFPDDATLAAVESYLGRLTRRQQVIASNTANIDTPGYKTEEIPFHATMNELLSERTQQLRVSRPQHRGGASGAAGPNGPPVFEVENLPSRPDGNNVNLEQELLKLGQTSFAYTSIIQLLRVKFRTIASSINEGRIG